MSNPPLWKAWVALAKGEASDMASLLELASEPQAVLIVEEPFGPSATVEALYTEEPDPAFLSGIAGRDVTVEPLPDQDWIRLCRIGLPPVRAGRFFVYGAHDAGQRAAMASSPSASRRAWRSAPAITKPRHCVFRC